MPDLRALVETYNAAWNSDDWEPALKALHHPEGEILSPEGWPEPGTFAGWPAIAEQYRRLKGSWAEERIESRSVEQAGGLALTSNRWLCRGETSGVEVEVDIWAVTEFRGELVWRIQYFLDEGDARTAVEEADR